MLVRGAQTRASSPPAQETKKEPLLLWPRDAVVKHSPSLFQRRRCRVEGAPVNMAGYMKEGGIEGGCDPFTLHFYSREGYAPRGSAID